jgi:hypothetical protein
LSAADWTTFNSKAPGVTFTTNYIPYGQGTTTLNQSANLTFDGTNLSVAGAVNKVTITSPATGSTLTIANNKTFTASNTLTLAGTDSTTMTFPTTSATIARTDAAQTFTGIQTLGTTASTGNYISVLGSDADNTYLVFSGARKYPRLDLADTVAGGSTFQFWNLGNQLRFGTNTGTAATASFYIASGNAGAVTFNGAFSAASNAVGSVNAKAGGLTAVTTVAGSLTLATGGVTIASQVMASGSVWRVTAYGTYAASSSANARTLTMACYWGTTALTSVTTGNVLALTAQTTPWRVELEITGSSATAAWCTAILSAQVTSATIPLNYISTAASVTGLTTTSTLDFRVGQTGTATAGDTINVHSVILERIK